MPEETQRGNGELPKGVPLGGSDLFSNFAAYFVDPLLSFLEGLGYCELDRTYWEDDGKNFGKKTNNWRGYNLKVNFKFPEILEIPKEVPEKPQYPKGNFMVINSKWLRDLSEKYIGGYKKELEEIYKIYDQLLNELEKNMPKADRKVVSKYKLKNPFSFIYS